MQTASPARAVLKRPAAAVEAVASPSAKRSKLQSIASPTAAYANVTKDAIVGTWFYDADCKYTILLAAGRLKYVEALEDGTRVEGDMAEISEDGIQWLVASLPQGAIRLRLRNGAISSQFKGHGKTRWEDVVTAAKKEAVRDKSAWSGFNSRVALPRVASSPYAGSRAEFRNAVLKRPVAASPPSSPAATSSTRRHSVRSPTPSVSNGALVPVAAAGLQSFSRTPGQHDKVKLRGLDLVEVSLDVLDENPASPGTAASPESGCRRSSRKSIRPLDMYRNERAVFERLPGSPAPSVRCVVLNAASTEGEYTRFLENREAEDAGLAVLMDNKATPKK